MNPDYTPPSAPTTSSETPLRRAILAAAPVMFGLSTQSPADRKPVVATPQCGEEMTTEEIRRNIAGLHRVSLNQVSSEAAKQYHDALIRQAEDCASAIISRFVAYERLFTRLDLMPAEVEPYIRRERRLLASLYFEAREPVPSPHQLRRLVYQLAIDVRHPVEGDLAKIECHQEHDGWRLRVHSTLAHRASALPPPDGDITAFSPLVPHVLACINQTRPDGPRLVNWIELVFGRQPVHQDTLDFSDTRELEFEIDGDHLQLWVGAVEVAGIDRKDEQALLRYFCDNPTGSCTGAELARRLKGKITNPSQAVHSINKALGMVLPEVGEWLLTKPIRWAAGVQVRPRAPK